MIEGTAQVGGLFGTMYMHPMETASLLINNVNVFGNNDVGGLIGFGWGGLDSYGSPQIYNLYIDQLKVEGSENVGGLIGHLSNANIGFDYLIMSGIISGETAVGGFVGKMESIQDSEDFYPNSFQIFYY